MAYACPECADQIIDYLRDGPEQKVLHAQKRFYNDSCCIKDRLFHGYNLTSHHPATEADRGHIVTMLRDPVQRIMSDHMHFGQGRREAGPVLRERQRQPQHAQTPQCPGTNTSVPGCKQWGGWLTAWGGAWAR